MRASTRVDTTIIPPLAAYRGVPNSATAPPAVGTAPVVAHPRSEGELSAVELAVAPSDHWLSRLSRRHGLQLRLVACRPGSGPRRDLLQLVELSGSRTALAEARTWLRAEPHIRRLVPTHIRDNRFAFWAASRLPGECAWAADSGAVCRTCRFLGTGASDDRPPHWTIVRPTGRPASRSLAVLRRDPRTGIGPVVSVRRWEPDGALTGRQEAALDVALRLGYFEVPRRAGLSKVAGQLRISRSAAAQLLRRGEARLLSLALDRNGAAG